MSKKVRGDNMSEVEQRFQQSTEVRVVKESDTITLEGYAAKFNERSLFMGFYEEVDKRAFNNTLEEGGNVTALYNHDPNKILGSTRNETLKVEVDDVGLRFTLTPKANTSFMNDVKQLVEHGEIRGMSFGFIAKEDEWRSEDGVDVRTLKEVSLKEITLTPYPAYEASEVAMRSHENFKKEIESNKELDIIALEMYSLRNKKQYE